MEDYLITGFTDHCGHGLERKNVVVLESCAVVGYQKLANLQSAHVTRLPSFKGGKKARRTNRFDYSMRWKFDSSNLMVPGRSNQSSSYTLRTLQIHTKSMRYHSSYKASARFLAEGGNGSDNSTTYCDGVCHIKSSMLEGLLVAVPFSARKATGGFAEGIAPFLQLLHFSENVIKKIARKAKLQRRRQELTQTTPDQPVDDEAVYYKVAGDCPKGCVYSLRSLWRKKRRYVDPDASTSQMLAQRGMGNFMILSTPKELLEGVQSME
ncbi:hypothetical protein Scep_010332 [Stephania cephalantha]|uniref:Uncharacterized protein n=1 Tax=Stephania cephalantha TaxID=152367 RepID=A0AAP0PH48_9MAGN